MHQQISKKIITYLFILFILGTFNNKKISKLYSKNNYNFNIVDQSEFKEDNINVGKLGSLQKQAVLLAQEVEYK